MTVRITNVKTSRLDLSIVRWQELKRILMIFSIPYLVGGIRDIRHVPDMCRSTARAMGKASVNSGLLAKLLENQMLYMQIFDCMRGWGGGVCDTNLCSRANYGWEKRRYTHLLGRSLYVSYTSIHFEGQRSHRWQLFRPQANTNTWSTVTGLSGVFACSHVTDPCVIQWDPRHPVIYQNHS